MEWLFYLLTGICSGLAAGLLGVGGGLIIVPLLISYFPHTSLPHTLHAHIAIATSLACIVTTSLSAIAAQHKKRAIIWPLVMRSLPGILLGAFLGANIAALIAKAPLIIIFTCFLGLIAYMMWNQDRPVFPRFIIPGSNHPYIHFLVMLIIGGISAIIGIGGGTMTVPYLSRLSDVPIALKNAIAVSSSLGFPIALSGSLGFILQAQSLPEIPGSLGFIYLPAFFTISASAFFAAKAGVFLSHYWSKTMVSRIFTVLLLVQITQLLHALQF